jgi:hypothetical protein
MATPKWLKWFGRGVSLVVGLFFAVGVFWKLVDWQISAEGLANYGTLTWIPPALLMIGSLVAETFVSATLLLPRTWHRWGLLSAAGFLLFTALVLSLEILTGGAGDCGCLPFLTREINWLSVGQNASAALLLTGIWGVIATGPEQDVGESELAPDAPAEPVDPVASAGVSDPD